VDTQNVNRAEALIERVKREVPSFNVIKRSDSRFLRTVFWPLQKVTGRTYGQYATTIFSTVYVPDDWDSWSPDRQYSLLRHEIMHIRQFWNWPFGPKTWWLNHFIVAFLYLLCLPVIWTMRAKFEREGYTQSMLVHHELGWLTDVESEVKWIADTFSNSSYLWMWRRGPAEAWARQTIAAIQSGQIVNDADRID
jgi:hypothetical protein